MNYYEYAGTEQVEDAVYLAAKDLMKNGFYVIPLMKGKKEPANIKNVYDLISKPIHDFTFDFYFKDRDVDLGIIMDPNMEFIDVDPKNKPGVEKIFLKAVRSGWPELFEKLVIDETPSGGCHVIYRAEVVGGPKSALAKVKASPNPLAIIERINCHNKQYIKISPSEGYKLLQGNPFEIPFLTAEERNWLSAVAASFNEVHTPEVKKKEAEREDSPWKVFNNSHDWKYTRNMLIDRHWTVTADREDKVLVKRPGDSAQKYSGIIFKDTNILYLFTPSTEFENEKSYTPFGVYTLLQHEGNTGAAMKQLASEGCGRNIYDEGQFWKRERSKIKIKYTELLNWFHSIGYRTYNKTIVQGIHNTVEIVEPEDMKRAFLNEVEFEIQDEMYEKVSTIFNEQGGLMSMLSEIEDNFIQDDKDSTWLFFRNIAIKITLDGITPYEYKTITGYIWKSDIIQRDYYGCDFIGCDAERFIKIIGGEKSESLQKIIGYSITKYKDPLNPRAVILMEDIDPENEGESKGGSGKGLCFHFIKQFRKTADFDGKNFRFADPFLYQNVDPDTAIIFIDDVEKNFKFSSLFSILTGPLLINKKNKQQAIIPFDKSPKIFLTSNYSIGGLDTSSKRRKYEFPIVKHFGEEIEPISIFKRQFFSGWDRDEWLRFDNFIIDCCIKYLKEGDKRSIGNMTDKSTERSLISNTSRDFVDYMDGQLSVNFFDFAPGFLKTATVKNQDGSVTANAVNMESYLKYEDSPDYYFMQAKETFTHKISKLCNYRNLTTTRVTQWVKRWADSRGVEIDLSYKRGADAERCYRIIKWPVNEFLLLPKKSENETGKPWEPNQEFEGF
jgi:hypothetical protein